MSTIEDPGRFRTLATMPSDPPERAFPDGAPNVVIIVLDDLGFAQLGCYGSDIDTPNLDALAASGVRFTNFHTTAVCSPTRACLLTGRNHHRVGMGMLPDIPMNFPGYRGEFPAGAGTLAQVLSAEGYATYAIGKWHLVPRDQRATGPYHMWPTGVGFDRYYGFLNGETNQWTPNLIRDHHHIEPPATPEEGYHLEADLADEAIAHLRELRLSSPTRPFFLWYASGAPHAPHQAPREWIDRYAGRFDAGWDVWRSQVLERQKALGLVPADLELPPLPEWVESWDTIDADRQRLYSRMMEVFAGFVSHLDHHVGRLIAHLDQTGELDNTIVCLVSDNGASAEGGPNGSWNQLRHYISDDPDDLDQELARLDDLGGHRSSGHYPWGWALAGNTPFQLWKRYTFEGGVRDPFIVSWPGGLAEHAGTVRDQYAHAIDVLPTIVSLLGVSVPSELGGIEQLSLDGTSLVDVLRNPAQAEVRTSQYYECWGSRAMYHDGWKAVTNHVNQLTKAERDALVGSHRFEDDVWLLFDTRVDPTEQVDLATTHPDKLAELVDRWHQEAERNDVFPLDDTSVNRQLHMAMPWMRISSVYELRRGDKVHENSGPLLFGGFAITARFSEPVADAASGTIIEQGDWISGLALVLIDGELVFVQHTDGHIQRTGATLPPGARILRAWATPAGDGSFDTSVAADDVVLAAGSFRSIPMSRAPDGAFLTVGYSRPFPVVDEYRPPFPAPTSLESVTITTGPPPPFDLDREIARVLRHQ
ncbi:MAG: arylsulfatase [Acidimicrobiales bacterium]|nr:arylsulfatase [Acidimicrobiales bacterium]